MFGINHIHFLFLLKLIISTSKITRMNDCDLESLIDNQSYGSTTKDDNSLSKEVVTANTQTIKSVYDWKCELSRIREWCTFNLHQVSLFIGWVLRFWGWIRRNSQISIWLLSCSIDENPRRTRACFTVIGWAWGSSRIGCD